MFLIPMNLRRFGRQIVSGRGCAIYELDRPAPCSSFNPSLIHNLIPSSSSKCKKKKLLNPDGGAMTEWISHQLRRRMALVASMQS